MPPPRPFCGTGIFWILLVGLLIATLSRNHNVRMSGFDSPRISFFGSDYDYDVYVTEPGALQSTQGVTRVVLDNLRGNLSLKGQGPDDTPGDIKVTGRKTIRAFSRAQWKPTGPTSKLWYTSNARGTHC